MARNPNFKRIERISTVEEQRESIKKQEEQTVRLGNEMMKEKNAAKQRAKEERWRTQGTLGERTEKYIREGESEDSAYRYAKEDLGL